MRVLKVLKKKQISQENMRMSQRENSAHFSILKDDMWSIYHWRSPYFARVHNYWEE